MVDKKNSNSPENKQEQRPQDVVPPTAAPSQKDTEISGTPRDGGQAELEKSGKQIFGSVNWARFNSITDLAITGTIAVATVVNVCIASRQWEVMQTQANIAGRQNEIVIESARAIVYAKEIKIEKKDGAIPDKVGQFEPYWWFSPVLENGGGTSTEHMRVSAQAWIDPSRPDLITKLPFGLALGPKQLMNVSRVPEAGPRNPEDDLFQSEELERQNKPSRLIRTILGPKISQTIAGFGVPIEETKRRVSGRREMVHSRCGSLQRQILQILYQTVEILFRYRL
jgi:hypothetical protein